MFCAHLLFLSLLTTLKIAIVALILSVIVSTSFSIVFYFSKFIERSLTPITVILQVTPIIAIAPLISIWVDSSEIATLICAFLVAFFPLLANTIAGFKSTEKKHLELLRLYGAIINIQKLLQGKPQFFLILSHGLNKVVDYMSPFGA